MGRGGRRSGRIIGVILPNVTNPFYSQALTGIENIARQRGYHAVVCNTLRDKTRERQYLEMLYDRGIRYVILSFVDFNADNISAFSQKGMCFVLLDQQVDDVDCGRVNFDMFGGAVLAVDYLIRMGHQRIALATTPLVRWTRVQVHRGYKAALEQAGLAYSQGDVFISSPEVEEEEEGYDILAGRQLAEMIAERRGEFSAILCVNDITCVGLIDRLDSLGLRIPEDISVISMDDIPIASKLKPALTTIRYPTYEGGRLAAMLLLDQMEHASRYGYSMKIEPRLIIRRSVRDLRGKTGSPQKKEGG